MRFLRPILCSLGFLAAGAQAEEKAWLDTYETGLQTAQEEEKDLLIAFMGSDWCEECKVLKPAVLLKEDFITRASEAFVLVELDFPQLNPELSKRNEPIRAQYGVKGYPMLLLTDSSGRPYGEVRYNRDWKVDDYLKIIAAQDANKVTRDEALVEFEQADQDEARVEALEKMLRAVPEPSIAKMYPEEFALLRQYSRDQSPMVKGIAKKEGLENLQEEIGKFMGQRRYEEAVDYCNRYLAQEGLDSHEKQAGLTMKYFSLMEMRDFEGAMEAAKDLSFVDPKSPIGRQALGLMQRAKAAFDAAGAPKPTRPVTPSKKPEASGLDEQKGTKPEMAATETITPETRVPVSAKHQKALQALDAAHQALAAAEEALAKAEKDLANAREKHVEAHQEEAKARAMEERKKTAKEEKNASEKETTPEAVAVTSPEIEEFEKNVEDLRKQAEELRKKSQQLREATGE
jgi:thioredoxin-related protein